MDFELCKMTVINEKSPDTIVSGDFYEVCLVGETAGFDEIGQQISGEYVRVVSLDHRQIVVSIISGVAVYDDIVSGEGIDTVTHTVSIFGTANEVAVVAGF